MMVYDLTGYCTMLYFKLLANHPLMKRKFEVGNRLHKVKSRLKRLKLRKTYLDLKVLTFPLQYSFPPDIDGYIKSIKLNKEVTK